MVVVEIAEDYSADMAGNIYSYKHGKCKILKPFNDNHGYSMVTINNKTMRVHRLVATAFLPNPNNLPDVNHDNGVKSDCSTKNLIWSTTKENCDHARFVLGTPGGNIPRPVYQILDGKIIKKWDNMSDPGKFGFKKSKIWNCCNNQGKTHRGFQWRYV